MQRRISILMTAMTAVLILCSTGCGTEAGQGARNILSEELEISSEETETTSKENDIPSKEVEPTSGDISGDACDVILGDEQFDGNFFTGTWLSGNGGCRSLGGRFRR